MSSSRPLTPFGPLCVFACAVALAGCDRQSDRATQPEAASTASSASSRAAAAADVPLSGTIDRSHKGEALPAYRVTAPGGRTLDLASLKGKPALVNLWATWCAPCVAELPTLDALAAAKAGKLRVVVVSQDLRTERVAAFLKDKGGTHLDPWLDPKTELSFRYSAPTLPTTVLYDAGGKELWRYVGGHHWTDAEAAKLLAEAGVS